MNIKDEDSLAKSQESASTNVQSETVRTVSKVEFKMEERQRLLKILYGQQLVTSFGNGMVSPFLSVYLIKIGGSASDLGWFQAITNFFTNTAQIFWGRLSDVTGKRVMFIVVGSLLSSILWAFMIGVRSPELFILIIALQSFLASMSAPALSALIAELSPTMQRGAVIGVVNAMGAASSLFATLISGFVMQMSLTSDVFIIPFIVASVSGIAGSLLILKMKNVDRVGKRVVIKDLFKYSLSSPFKNRTFRVFIGVSFLSNFMMAISWPLFNITTIKLLNATMLEIAILSVISGFSTFMSQRYVGKLADKVGRRSLMLINRFGLVSVPLFYAFAPDMSILYISSLSTGVLIAAGNVAFIAYVIDVSNPIERASYIALYNAANGTSAFFGSLLGGYIGNIMIEKFGLRNGLMYTYLISAIGRASAALMFLKVKDVMKFPETIFSEFIKITDKIHHKNKSQQN
ncbi:MAG: MFS transporter [Thermoprotei archaeon]